MAHFAEINQDNIVTRVIVVNNSDCLKDGVEDEATGIAFCQSLLGGKWIQTSYNGNFRKRYAGRGYFYDQINDAFIAPQPFPSWVLDQDFAWQAPTPMPTDGKPYRWAEETLSWEEVITET